MGADGTFNLVEIGRNQHLLRDDMIRFVVDDPVVVLFLSVHRFGRHRNLSSDYDDVDKLIVDREALLASPIYGETEGSQAKQCVLVGGIAVVRQSLITPDVISTWESYEGVNGVDYGTVKKAWDEILPGFWVLHQYSTCGVGDHYFGVLDNEVEQLKTVSFECWT